MILSSTYQVVYLALIGALNGGGFLPGRIFLLPEAMWCQRQLKTFVSCASRDLEMATEAWPRERFTEGPIWSQTPRVSMIEHLGCTHSSNH